MPIHQLNKLVELGNGTFRVPLIKYPDPNVVNVGVKDMKLSGFKDQTVVPPPGVICTSLKQTEQNGPFSRFKVVSGGDFTPNYQLATI